MRTLPALGAAALLLALAGCNAPPPPNTTGANPYPPVPVAQVDPIPRPPVSAVPLLWQPGHYDWTGSGYAWTQGVYIPRDGRSGQWQQGYWRRDADLSWHWVPAHWAA